jgi:rubrerythrin
VGREHDIRLLREALALEEEAVDRYVAHRDAARHPRLVQYWESLRRNESGHRRALRECLARLETQSAAGAAPDAGAERAEGARP